MNHINVVSTYVKGKTLVCVHLILLVSDLGFFYREFIRDKPVKTVGLKRTGNTCLVGGARGRCRYSVP